MQHETGVVSEANGTRASGGFFGSRKIHRSNVCVIEANKQPRDPVHPGRARLLLTQGKAAVFTRFPLTIILKAAIEQPEVHPRRLTIDPGSRTTGLALVDDVSGRVVFAGTLTHRGQTIKKALDLRRAVRQGRRQRTTRYRQPRFDTRRRSVPWLPPSPESRVASVLTRVRRLRRLCPIAAISMEPVTFDLQQMENPETSGVVYQQGDGTGFERRDYLLAKWQRPCASCGAHIVPPQIEHMLARANGRTFNRRIQGLPKERWIDAACVGKSTPVTLSLADITPLLIASTGHGSRQTCKVTASGFPCSKPKGFQTGDLVRAVVPRGNKQGAYVGQVPCESAGRSISAPKTIGCKASAIGSAPRSTEPMARVIRWESGMAKRTPPNPPDAERAIPPLAEAHGHSGAVSVNIQTVQFAHILEKRDLETLHDFLSQTAFVISHKNESIETLLGVLWYIPVNSTIIVVTNCPEHARDDLTHALRTRLAGHHKTYLFHQKDARLAHLFHTLGIPSMLDADGRVRSGKGEGMYIGTLCAYQLSYPRWLIFYDADNFVPSALLEYTLAMGRLFLAPPTRRSQQPGNELALRQQASTVCRSGLHNVRICWASKPEPGQAHWQAGIMGRTTKVVSPLFESLLAGWFGICNHQISSSNAGEQGMTVQTASALRFSSGFSIETFQFLELLSYAHSRHDPPREVTVQQYLSQSPHFHEKKGDEHIKQMTQESLGSFFHFEQVLPEQVLRQLQQVYRDLQLTEVRPVVYPRLQDVPLATCAAGMHDYALFPEREWLAVSAGVTLDLLPDATSQSALVADIESQHVLVADPPCQNPPHCG